MDLLVDWNGKNLKRSYWISFQIIYNVSICDVTWFFFLMRNPSLKKYREVLVRIFLMAIIEPYFHKSLTMSFNVFIIKVNTFEISIRVRINMEFIVVDTWNLLLFKFEW